MYLPHMDVLAPESRTTLLRACRSRDNRFDGRFYVGVVTTGIYCRPICPARPKRENMRFFRTTAEAESHGFRACLRCRPDLTPLSCQWGGTSAVVGRALKAIETLSEKELTIEKLSERLGVASRHLRRLFAKHLGASPKQIHTASRLHLTKQLLQETSLPITEIAFSSGFSSVRRFNAAFRERFKVAPTSFRRTAPRDVSTGSPLTLQVATFPPYDWDFMLRFLSAHAIPGVEHVTPDAYERLIPSSRSFGKVRVAPGRTEQTVEVTISMPDVHGLKGAIERVRDLFDLRLNPYTLLDTFESTHPLDKLLHGAPGIRIPGAWDPFETAVAVIVSQQISVPLARKRLGALVAAHGTAISASPANCLTHLFPTPEQLASFDDNSLGLTSYQRGAIRSLAKLVLSGGIDLSRTCDLRKIRETLDGIPGIGAWSRELICLRCLGDSDAWPDTDLVIGRLIREYPEPLPDRSPWRGYVAMALWREAYKKGPKQVRRKRR